jgi:hypothetical protein
MKQISKEQNQKAFRKISRKSVGFRDPAKALLDNSRAMLNLASLGGRVSTDEAKVKALSISGWQNYFTFEMSDYKHVQGLLEYDSKDIVNLVSSIQDMEIFVQRGVTDLSRDGTRNLTFESLAEETVLDKLDKKRIEIYSSFLDTFENMLKTIQKLSGIGKFF